MTNEIDTLKLNIEKMSKKIKRSFLIKFISHLIFLGCFTYVAIMDNYPPFIMFVGGFIVSQLLEIINLYYIKSNEFKDLLKEVNIVSQKQEEYKQNVIPFC